MYEEIISAVTNVDDNAHLHRFQPLTKRGESIVAKDVIGDERKCADARLLKQCKKGCLALNLRLEPIIPTGLNCIYEKMTASIMNVKTVM